MAAIASHTITVKLDAESLQIIRDLHERLDRMQEQIDRVPKQAAQNIADGMMDEMNLPRKGAASL